MRTRELCLATTAGFRKQLVQLRQFLDERIPAPWVHWEERKLHHLKDQAYEQDAPLDVVVG